MTPMKISPIELIALDERGIAYVAGTKMKVAQLVAESKDGATPAGLVEYHPHLSLAQIYAALSYAASHREEIEAYLEEYTRFSEEMRRTMPQRPHSPALEAALAKRRNEAA